MSKENELPNHYRLKNFLFVLLLSCITASIEFFLLVKINFLTNSIALPGGNFSIALKQLDFVAYFPLIFFIVIVLLFHTIFSWLIAMTAQYICFKTHSNRLLTVSFIVWIIGYVAILMLNNIFFPSSEFIIFPLHFLSVHNIVSYGIIVCSMFFLAVIFYFSFLQYVRDVIALKSFKIISGLFVFIALTFLSYHIFSLYQRAKIRSGYINHNPNIIIFMYCSLRADMIDNTVSLKDFSEKSIWFKNAFSPTARSGSSTYTILSGLYPYRSGYFFNLNEADPSLNFNDLITYQLKKEGYQTLFLTNINLFRKINHEVPWGFDVIDGSPHDVFSFILTKLGDIPLINLLMHIHHFKMLFPYHYSNVESALHYQPQTFLTRLKYLLKYQLKRKPVFLLINDEMMHFPYLYPGDYYKLNGTATTASAALMRYLKLLKLEDLYFNRDMQALKTSGLLNNAVVIVVSDHGESFGDAVLADGPFYSMAHGNSAFAEQEYHVPLIFHFYNADAKIAQPQKINTPVSTLDIAPTVMSLLNNSEKKSDGISLLSAMQGIHILNDDRILFRQTGVSFHIKPGDRIDTLAEKKIQQYDIHPRGQVNLKQSVINNTKHQIQYAAQLKNFLLVYIPRSEDSNSFYFLINKENNRTLRFENIALTTPLSNLNSASLKHIKISTTTIKKMQKALIHYVTKSF